MELVCRNCLKRNPTRPRGLCYRCWQDARIRAAHPITSRYARGRLGGDFNGGNQLPPCPTQAIPGSERKIQILEARCAAKVALHHPLDYSYPIL